MKRILFGGLGGVIGSVVGYLIAVVWFAYTGNLMMPQPVYEAKKTTLQFILWAIVGTSTFLGAVVFARMCRTKKSLLGHYPESTHN